MQAEKHPPGLVVLFMTEMWERFSFYSMIAMFVLYLRDPTEGFGWSLKDATILFSNYLMFVYASPFIGGWLADWKLGYRRAVLIGGVFFMAGHLLLAFRSLEAVYAALTCLVIGNGFFKPNVSTMVGNLYPEGSPLKDSRLQHLLHGDQHRRLARPHRGGVRQGLVRFPHRLRGRCLWYADLRFHSLVVPRPRRRPRRNRFSRAWDDRRFRLRQVEDAAHEDHHDRSARHLGRTPTSQGTTHAVPPSPTSGMGELAHQPRVEDVPEWQRIAPCW